MIQFSVDNKPAVHNEAGQPEYDTKAGILKSLESFTVFLKLIEERHRAGYNRKERLNEFYVLGRFHLDTCGNFRTLTGYVPKDKLPYIPDVLSDDDFMGYINRHSGIKGGPPMIVTSLGVGLPDDKVLCPVCGKGWNIDNCHDTVLHCKTDDLPLAEFVGKTLGEVKRSFAEKTDAVYFMQSNHLIRHDRFIDLSPKYPEPKHDWQKNIVKNNKGWVSEQDGITDDYAIQEGDEGFFNVWTFFHSVCNHKHLLKTEREKFMRVFEKAGFKNFEMVSIPNQYCSCRECAPWFEIQTEFGMIVVGWYKRGVISINWGDVAQATGKDHAIYALFDNEDVTRGTTTIHAWGWEKAEDYLRRIHTLLTTT